jgi:hypothetical protein
VTVLKKKRLVLALFAAAMVIAVNAFAYTNILNGSNTMLNLVKKFNFAYVTPKTYINLARKLQRNTDYNTNNIKQMDSGVISERSVEFIAAAFKRNDKDIERMLDSSAKYIKSKDGSGFIRYIGNGVHVEGYMATDKRLIKSTKRWHVIEDDNTITCSMEVFIEGMPSPQLWYLHFRKVKSDWKIFMLENDI